MGKFTDGKKYILSVITILSISLTPACGGDKAGTCGNCSTDSDCEDGLRCGEFQMIEYDQWGNPTVVEQERRCQPHDWALCKFMYHCLDRCDPRCCEEVEACCDQEGS